VGASYLIGPAYRVLSDLLEILVGCSRPDFVLSFCVVGQADA
jgi:hypothetical protein